MQFLDGAVETWTLNYDDFAFIAEQQKPARIDLAVKLLSYRAFGRFHPYSEIDDKIVHYVGDQLSFKPSQAIAPVYTIQTERRRRHVILDYLDVADCTEDYLLRLQEHLTSDPALAAMKYTELEAVMLKWAVDNQVSPPPAKWMKRSHASGSDVPTRIAVAYFTISSYCCSIIFQSMTRVKIGVRLSKRPFIPLLGK